MGLNEAIRLDLDRTDDMPSRDRNQRCHAGRGQRAVGPLHVVGVLGPPLRGHECDQPIDVSLYERFNRDLGHTPSAARRVCSLRIARQSLEKSRHAARAEVEESGPLRLYPDEGHLVVDRPHAALELRDLVWVQRLPRGCDVVVGNAVDDVHGCHSTHQELLRVRGRVADIDRQRNLRTRR